MSGRTLFLHIGSNKTGTSSIQAALRVEHQTLEQHGIAVLGHGSLGENLTNRSLFHIFNCESIRRVDLNNFSTEGAYRRHRLQQQRQFRRLLGPLPHQQVVVSDEYLFTLPTERIDRMAHSLRKWGFDRVTVLLYLREPTSMYLSYVQQLVKADHRIPDPEHWIFPYQDRVEAWSQAFGTQLILRVYERSQLHNNTSIDDFALEMATAFALGTDSPAIKFRTGFDHNVSLSAEGFQLLHAYQSAFHADNPGRFTPDSTQLLRTIAICEQGLQLSRPVLKPEVRRQILMGHADQLVYLATRHGFRFPSVDHEDLPREQGIRSNKPGQDSLTVPDLVNGLDAERLQRLQLACLQRLCQSSSAAAP